MKGGKIKAPKYVLAHRIGLLLTLAVLGLFPLSLYLQSRNSPFSLQILGLLLLAIAGVCVSKVCVVCPHCGASLYPSIFPGRFALFYTAFHPLPKRCPRCGEALKKDD